MAASLFNQGFLEPFFILITVLGAICQRVSPAWQLFEGAAGEVAARLRRLVQTWTPPLARSPTVGS